MSDQGEKTCPLCAEEMDLTDQQLKPCKCGYEICVWCWHHIMDMAEKDDTEGRCPACRTAYNKEKIVATAASRERLSEMNAEKKVKSQKGKSKTSEGRKQLASVRVIQRNLVYVVGLPLNFADEDLLQRREYFGQYGKVLKVSISRTAAGAIQQFPNSTCSVYITYSKEDEAVRCIQSVHGFLLDSRPLKACFGTTKYCHAWLRNVACSNPDCLYLHEIGSQEDSFSKDETISAYTRSRVQQITGSTNSTQRRSGNVLPPPADEYCNNSSTFPGKPITKIAVNTNQNSANNSRASPPNSSSGRSAALPAGASWGTRASDNQPLLTSTQCSNEPLEQKQDVCNGPVACSTADASPVQLSSLHTANGKMVPNEDSTISHDKSKTGSLKVVKKEPSTDGRTTVSGSSSSSVHSATLSINRQPHSPPSNNLLPNSTINDSSLTSSRLVSDKDSFDAIDDMENICIGVSSMDIHENRTLENGHVQRIQGSVSSQTSVIVANTSEVGFTVPTEVTQVHETEDDLLSFESQRLKDPEVVTNRMTDFSHASHWPKHSNILSPQFGNADGSISVDLDRQVADRNSNLIISTLNFPGGHPENMMKSSVFNNIEYTNLLPSKEKRSVLGRYEGEVSNGSLNMGESSIISNILSMDFDSWDESLTSPQNMAKLLGQTDRQQGTFGVSGSHKIQNINQSRFSFAREEEPISLSNYGQSIDYFDKGSKHLPFGHDLSNRNSLHHEKFVSHNGFPAFNGVESDIFSGNHSHNSANRLSASRSQISAPPGFSVPHRAPPPGFTSHERAEQLFDGVSENHQFDGSSLLRNHYQTSSGGNTIMNGDIEFMDPAILAVGKGTLPVGINNSGVDLRSNYSSQFNPYDEARFQSLLQRPLPPHQNHRFTDLGDNFSHLGDAYGLPSRVMEQTLANNSPFSQFSLPQSRNGMTSNGQWNGWNEVQGGNNLGMVELLRNERLGFNKFYGGYEDSKIRMSTSGNLYNGMYGI